MTDIGSEFERRKIQKLKKDKRAKYLNVLDKVGALVR
jgi:hypothetical protein